MSARTPEGKITEKILKYLNALPQCVARKVVASPMNRAGEPDIDCVLGGRAVKLEVKQPGTEHSILTAVTPLQRLRLLAYAEAGALVGVVTTVDEAACVLGHRLKTSHERELTALVRSRMAMLGAMQRGADVESWS
jgi:hypothetical protein